MKWEKIGKRPFYIDGRWIDLGEAKDLEVIDPSTEEACAVISLASPAHKVFTA